MKKIFIAFSFALLLIVKAFGQAVVEIPFTVTDSNGNTRTLIFGLDLSATPGIDPLLGEEELPPLGIGWFDARFISLLGHSQLGEGTYKDIRNALAFPFSGTRSHRVRFQFLGGPNWELQTITISWNLPPEIVEGSTITLLGGTPVPFVGSGSIIVTPLEPDRFNIFVVYSDIVPVELTSFTVSVLQNEKTVQLNWTTATETNNSGFEILRSCLAGRQVTQNDNDWSTIGFVPGFGTTTEPKSYSFTNEDITTGIYKYLLKQIDLNGTFEYSKEIEVEVDFTPKEFVLYQNYPNPFNPSTTVKFEIPNVETTRRVVFTTLKVYDILGNEVATLINEEKQPGVYEVEFDLESGIKYPASGVYFYQLKAGSFSKTKKMILLR